MDVYFTEICNHIKVFKLLCTRYTYNKPIILEGQIFSSVVAKNNAI